MDHAPTVRITAKEQGDILGLAKKLATLDPVHDCEAYVSRAQLVSAQLPERLRQELLRFRRRGNPAGGLLIRGLPTGLVPATPSIAHDAVGTGLAGSAVMSIVAAVLGEQFGFAPELGGNIVQDILPMKGAEDTQKSVSSRTALLTHVEMAFTEYRADYVALFCLRQDHKRTASTTLSSVEAILPLLADADVAVLQERRFTTTVDGSFLEGLACDGEIRIGGIAVLSGSSERPRLRADFAETRGVDREAQGALDRLAKAVDEVAIGIRLQPGDLLFVDNHHAFHGRTPFAARWDGRDRWLLRTFVTRDLQRSAEHRPGDGRIIDTDYSQHPDAITDDDAQGQVA
jgi:L-asparagine oxygenase